MAKITLPTIAAGYASNATFNTAFDLIDAEFQSKVLYRNNPSGEPNTMQNLLDMNSNPINNVTMLTATGITVAGVNLTAKVAEAAASAAAAVVSKNAAAASATAAAASYDSFDDRYLGAKGSAPSTDNDGGALLTGAIYFNSSSNQIFAWTAGDAWVAIKPTSSEQTAITAVAADATDIGAVAGKATEIGRLGTSAAVADMAILGTSAIVADMALLATDAIVADMAILGSDTVIADMAILATSAIVADMAILGTSDVVNDMNVLGTSANVTAMNLLGTSAVVTDMGILGTAAIVEDMGILGSSATVTAMGLLGTSANVTAMGVLGTSANVTNMTAVASNISGVNSFADLYRGASASDPGGTITTGSLFYDTDASPKQLKIYNGSAWVTAAFDSSGGAVSAFNGRTGSVSLSNADVVGALSTGGIATAKLADSAVTTAKIADDAVTAAKLANSINSAITANTAKTGITSGQASAIVANTAKTGITSGQTSAITANTAKVTNATHSGDVTGATALTIANNAVTKAKVNFISNSTAGVEVKGDGSSQDGYIQLNCSQNSHGVKIKSPPHSAGASYTLTLPNNDGDADQYLKTNGSGVTSWASVATGAPSQVLVDKSITGGSVTATRAVSMASDGSVGVYPTINSFGTRINQTQGLGVVALGTGTTKCRVVFTQISSGASSALDTNRATLYGSYKNGSGVWTENSTPLVIDCLMISGDQHSENGGQLAALWAEPGAAGKWVLQQTGRMYVNRITAIQVNASNGAPTTFGTSHRRATNPGGGQDGGFIRIGLDYFSFWENNVNYPLYWFNPASGMDLMSTGVSSTLRGQFYTQDGGISRKMSIEVSNRLFWFQGNTLNSIALSSHNPSGSKTSTTITDDYQSGQISGFLDSSHFLTYYKDSSGVWKFRTYSFNSSTAVSLIDTHVAPTDFTDHPVFWAAKDSRNLLVGHGGTPNPYVSSIQMASDFTIVGTNVKLPTVYNTQGDIMARWSGSGDVYNIHLLDATAQFTQPVTVNAYATTYFTYGGIATASASSGTTPIAVAGVAAGYSGLTTGLTYYVGAAYNGTISTTITDNKIGKAISATQISLGDIQ